MNRYLRNPWLLLLALFIAGELIVRVFFARNMTGRFEYGYHPTAGFVEKVDGSVQLVRAGGRRFRPQTFSRQRPAGGFRVMVIGDSVPRGPSLEGAYAAQLAEQLCKEGLKAEAINLAVAGNGAQRSQIILRKALEYQPSLVILHVNNSNEYEDEREFKRSEEFKSWHPRNWAMKSLLLRRLYEAKTEKVFWEWLPAEIRNQKAVSDADAEVAASMNTAKLREWDDRVKRFTSESLALARARVVPVLIVTQVRREADRAGGMRLDDHGLDELVQPLTGEGVELLSLKKLLEPLPCETLFADSVHFNRAGHAVIAASIARRIRERLKL
jgi:lysophospholipase L1-like esterase